MKLYTEKWYNYFLYKHTSSAFTLSLHSLKLSYVRLHYSRFTERIKILTAKFTARNKTSIVVPNKINIKTHTICKLWQSGILCLIFFQDYIFILT